MTAEQSISYMNIMARLLKIIAGFSLPFYEIHALTDFDLTGESARGELDGIWQKRTDFISVSYKDVRVDSYKIKKMYLNGLNHEAVINNRLRNGLDLACSNTVDIVFAPEMLGTTVTEQLTGKYNNFIYQTYGQAIRTGKKPPLLTIMPSYWHNGINRAAIIYRDGSVLGYQQKYVPYIDFKSCAQEGLRKVVEREIQLIHIYGVHRMVISICAEFLDDFDKDFICGSLGATLVVVPSFSQGERDFVNTLPSLFPYGTSVVWGDCCGAVKYAPKVIGGCGVVGTNTLHTMGDAQKCSFSCGTGRGCLFTIDFPMKIIVSKDKSATVEPIRHILK